MDSRGAIAHRSDPLSTLLKPREADSCRSCPLSRLYLVLLFVNTVTFALSAAASDARSEAEAMPGRIVEAERQSRRGPDRRRLVEPAIDRAPAPPAPEGWWGAKNDANRNERA